MSINVLRAKEADAPGMAACFYDAFVTVKHEQAKFYGALLPDKAVAHKFFEDSFSRQLRDEPKSVFLKAVDTSQNDKVVGFVKWTPPGTPDSYWAEADEGINMELFGAFFAAMAENRANLMGDRPHWYLELMGVNAEYARKGIGARFMEEGCKLVDADGLESYVDASPLAEPLYARYGFERKNTKPMPAPFDWYVERFAVRPKKA